jgi:uncharacterized protein (DUF934 family)
MALHRLNPAAPDSPALTLANTADVALLGEEIGRLNLIVLQFPKFTDGRAYSQARLLRSRLHYRGELRATGAVFLDQLPFMLRVGFDAFESEQKGFGEALARARTLFSVVYQPAEDGRTPVSALRLRAGEERATLHQSCVAPSCFSSHSLRCSPPP